MSKEILNARIKFVDLSMVDHGCLTLCLNIEGYGWACTVGGYCLGHGCLGAKTFSGSAKGIEEIMRIMDTVGVEKFSDLEGKYIRVEIDHPGCNPIKKIGNIIENKWFDYDEFYKEEREKNQ